MEIIYLLIFILLFNLACVASEMSLRFVFIIENHEPELARQIGRSLKIAEENRPDVRVSDEVILLDREDDTESYRKLCAAVSRGASLIIDLSWTPWPAVDDLCSTTGLPLVRTQLGSQNLLAALDDYLETRNATDAAVLLETESEVDKTLYELLGRSNVRVWVHAGLTRDSARSLKSMRPEPSFYVIVGTNAFVMDTYRRCQQCQTLDQHQFLAVSAVSDTMSPEPSFYVIVGTNAFVMDTYRRAVKENLVRRDYRWNLVFTDYSANSVDVSQLVLPTVLLAVDQSECCELLGRREDCGCSSEIQRSQYIITALVQYITEVYSKLDHELQLLTLKVDCDDIEGSDMNVTRDRMYRQFVEDTDMTNDTLFFWNAERSGLFLRSRFVLSTVALGERQTTASWSAAEQYRLLPGVVLQPLKIFFRIGTSPAVPWTLPRLDPVSGEQLFGEDGAPLYQGYCIDLIAKLAETMNFDYEIVTPKTGGFGKKLPNGSWDGVVGDLMRGETDIAVAALTMTAEREEVIDFVAPYFEQTGILIAIRKPIRKTSLFKFMTVLRTEVWLSIVAALLLTGFMIWLLDKYSPYSARNNPDAYPYPCREFTLKESFWFALTSFTPQGGGEAPKALSGRTLVAAYWLFVVLMLATFTANLAAFLTVERMQTPVSSLEQLARQSRINYTVVEGSSVHQYFINMKFAEDTLYRVWKEITLNATSDQAQYRVWDYPIREQYGHILLAINASGPVPDAKTGFEQVNEHTDADFAFIHDSAEIKYEVTRNCNLTEVGEVFAEQPYALAVQQGSRLQEDLSRALLELQKERFLEQLAGKYWNESARQACPDADESEGITLESLGGVFIATLFGLGLAMITLAWEVFYYKRKEKNKVKSLEHVEKTVLEKIPEKKVDNFTKVRKRGKMGIEKKGVTIGDSFKPVADKISYISVYPKGDYRP